MSRSMYVYVYMYRYVYVYIYIRRSCVCDTLGHDVFRNND
jgi:hypothetical protein